MSRNQTITQCIILRSECELASSDIHFIRVSSFLSTVCDIAYVRSVPVMFYVPTYSPSIHTSAYYCYDTECLRYVMLNHRVLFRCQEAILTTLVLVAYIYGYLTFSSLYLSVYIMMLDHQQIHCELQDDNHTVCGYYLPHMHFRCSGVCSIIHEVVWDIATFQVEVLLAIH